MENYIQKKFFAVLTTIYLGHSFRNHGVAVGTSVADSRIYEYVVSKEGRWPFNIKETGVLYNNILLFFALNFLFKLKISFVNASFTRKHQAHHDEWKLIRKQNLKDYKLYQLN